MQEGEKSRFIQIDMAKGIGILLVMLGHVLPNDNFVRDLIYSFHIPLFFVLSGIVFNDVGKENKSKVAFWGGWKLLLHYCLWSVFYLVFNLLVRCIILKEVTLHKMYDYIYRAITLYGINVLWFLGTLFLVKGLVYLTWKITHRNKLRVLLILLLCLLSVASSFLLEDISNIQNKTILYPISTMVRTLLLTPFFFLGIYLKRGVIELLKWRIYQRIILTIVLIFIWFFGAIKTGKVDINLLIFGNNPLLGFFSSISGSLMVISTMCLLDISFVKKFLCFFGKNSLFIMLTHEYLYFKEIIIYFLSMAVDKNSECIFLGLEFCTLVLVEVIIVRLLGGTYNYIFKTIYRKIENLFSRKLKVGK